MSDGQVIFLTHADVVIEPSKPPAEWSLSQKGRRRHQAFARNSMLRNVSAVFSSEELKARQGAKCVADVKGHAVSTVCELGECDRSSTGYLPKAEFHAAMLAFFENPDVSCDGWETANSAMGRIVRVVQKLKRLATALGDILIVAHGTVGALLRCHLLGIEVSQEQMQPSGGQETGGHYFCFGSRMGQPPSDWVRI